MSRNHTKLNARRWKRLRRRILARDNWRCRACGKAGRLEVDHIQPLEKDGDPWNENNLQALCRGCHILKTARENTKPVDPAVLAWREFVQELAGQDG